MLGTPGGGVAADQQATPSRARCLPENRVVYVLSLLQLDFSQMISERRAVKALIPHLSRSIQRIWCPFDRADSQFVIQLRLAGFEVHHSHLDAGQDFFTYEPPTEWDAILSNPPFTDKAMVFDRAMSFGKPFGLLMTLTWLNDSAPKRIFPALELLMFRERIVFLNCARKITFSTAYFCQGLLRRAIVCDSLRPYGYGKSKGAR